jgi:hypothetical protein
VTVSGTEERREEGCTFTVVLVFRASASCSASASPILERHVCVCVCVHVLAGDDGGKLHAWAFKGLVHTWHHSCTETAGH